MEVLRLFLAIDIPPFAREIIREIQNRFKTLDLNVTWVKPANIHLTLKFLGNTSPAKVKPIKERLLKALAPLPRCSFSLGELGVFPSFNNPRVLWVGLEDPRGHLESLQNIVEAEMVPLGFPVEMRAFSPHLTLGRIKSPRGKDRLKHEVHSIRMGKSARIEVSSVWLLQSQLTPQGSIYTALEEFSLKGPASTH